MKSIYPIREYGSFITKTESSGYVTLPESTFCQLENFILTNRSKGTDALELMGLSAKKGIGKIITAKNYVGIITLKDETTIEILPKIYSAIEDDKSGTRTKRLLVEMLKTLGESPFKSLQTSHVSIEKMNIFEVFIRMFVNEVFVIVKRGLKRSYKEVEENAMFFKGKIKFSEQLKQNHAHRERSYVEYDMFTINCPENRLLKTTLQHLYQHSTSSKNKNDIKILLNTFVSVDVTMDFKSDFSKCTPNRNTKDYATALLWSQVFLMGKSFSSFTGEEVSLALLFPMETLFESYIAALLKKGLSYTDFTVSTQDKSFHLIDEPIKKFLMKPDIVVKRKMDGSIFVLDTKWKILDVCKSNYGISQADMYQMYAYQKKYSAENVTLLYPRTEKVPPDGSLVFRSQDGVIVRVQFVDLFDSKNSIEELLQLFAKVPGGNG